MKFDLPPPIPPKRDFSANVQLPSRTEASPAAKPLPVVSPPPPPQQASPLPVPPTPSTPPPNQVPKVAPQPTNAKTPSSPPSGRNRPVIVIAISSALAITAFLIYVFTTPSPAPMASSEVLPTATPETITPAAEATASDESILEAHQSELLELAERDRKLKAMETRQNSPDPAASVPPTVVVPAQTPPAALSSGAMPGERFPQTRTRIMTATELQSWSANDIQYAINEVFARNGADFQDDATKNIFAKFSWYHPRVRVPFSEIEHSFEAIEAANVKLLGYYRDAINVRERFPQTRTRSMTLEEIRSWSDEKLRYAINEMYARHGAEIENPMIRKQFSRLDWYRPVPGKTYGAAQTEFSAVEKYNVHLLNEYRKALQNKAK
jgi:hypothetical protein